MMSRSLLAEARGLQIAWVANDRWFATTDDRTEEDREEEATADSMARGESGGERKRGRRRRRESRLEVDLVFVRGSRIRPLKRPKRNDNDNVTAQTHTLMHIGRQGRAGRVSLVTIMGRKLRGRIRLICGRPGGKD